MHSFFHDFKYVIVGGLITPVVEYFRKYNLLDYARDGVVALLRHKVSDGLGLAITLALFGAAIFLLVRY